MAGCKIFKTYNNVLNIQDYLISDKNVDGYDFYDALFFNIPKDKIVKELILKKLESELRINLLGKFT